MLAKTQAILTHQADEGNAVQWSQGLDCSTVVEVE